MSTLRPGYTDQERRAAACWVARLHSGSCTPADRRAFEAWLAQRESHRAAYAAVRGVWDSLESLKSLHLPELAAARASGYRGRRSGYRKAAAITVRLALTAVVLALVFVPALWWPAPIETYRTAKGEQQSLTLPDGSQAVLDTDTLLRTGISSTARTVYLDRGRACFTVSHDRDRPFEVRVDGGRIRDLGTRFDVHRRADRVSVTVAEGRVSVAAGDPGRPTELRAGEGIAFGRDGRLSPTEPADVAAATLWLSGKLCFRAAPLAEVLEEVARYHEAELLLPDPRLRQLAVTGTFNPRDLDRFLTNGARLPVRLFEPGTDHNHST